METVLSVALGIGLAAACGFRIFVPFLVLSIASQVAGVQLSPGFEWIGTSAALAAFAVATALEVTAYFVPWLDNLLDTMTTPVTVIAGILATASVMADVSPLVRWTVAVIAGGGIAGSIQGGLALIRGMSSALTAGLGNVAVASLELVGSLVMSVVAILVPLLGIVVAAGLVALAARMLSRSRARKNVRLE